MRRLARRLVTLCSAVSLLLCVAAGVVIWSQQEHPRELTVPRERPQRATDDQRLDDQQYKAEYRRIIDAWYALRRRTERFETFTRPEQVLLCCVTLNTEVSNGGFDQFFFNSDDEIVAGVIPALREVGDADTARIVQDASSAFGKGGPPKDMDDRQDWLIRRKPPSADVTWDKLEREFYDTKRQRRQWERLIHYVAKHRREFRDWPK